MARQHSPTDDLRDLRAIFSPNVDLSAHERLVMAALVLHRNGETGRCDPSVSRLADETGVSRWSVMRAIEALEDHGLVECHRRNGARTTYTLHPPTSSTQLPVAESNRLHTATQPVAESNRTSSTQLPERTKNERITNEDGSSRKRKNYPSEFEAAWSIYPKREGSNPKKAAYRAWRARIRSGVGAEELRAGVERYAAYCDASHQTGSRYVMRASTFFGPDEHWAESYAFNDGGDVGGLGPMEMTPEELRREAEGA